MGIMKRMLTVIICSVVFQCGIFSPRDDFELPGGDESTGDPYSFAELLEGSGERFSELDWYDLFDEGFNYVNVRLANIVYDRSALISRLYLLREMYPRIVVTWQNNDRLLREIDTITLNNVFYAVADKDAPDHSLYSGNSGFIIVRDYDKVWRILKWTDEPSGDAFFSPVAE